MNKYLLVLILSLMGFCGCKKTTDVALAPAVYKLSYSADTIHYDQQKQFTLVNGSQDSVKSSDVTWSTSDTLTGKINGSGLFKAKRIGIDTIIATGTGFKLTAIITVKPYYQLFKEPYFIIGADTSLIESKEFRVLSNKDESSITGDDRVLLSYHGENSNISTVTYTFVDDKLIGSMLYLTGNNDLSFVQKLMTFYAERYPLADITDSSSEDFYGPYSTYIEVRAGNLDNITVSY